MPVPKQVHVVVREGRWAVVLVPANRTESVHDRRDDAIAAAHQVAQRESAEVVVFRLDGTARLEGENTP